MRFERTMLAALMLSLASGAAATAGQMKVEGVHLCCGACVKAVNAAFEGVEGITNLTVDKDAGTVVWEAADRKTAQKGIQALAKAGFGGKAAFDGKPVNFPKGVKEEATGDSVTIGGLHNCCDGCADAITAALKGVKGVAEAKCNKRQCTVTGTAVSHTALIEALHAAGLHGNIAMPKKPE